MPKKKSPAAVRRQGFDDGKAVRAISFLEATASHDHLQEQAAVRHLMTRFGMPPATAALVVELAGIGGAR